VSILSPSPRCHFVWTVAACGVLLAACGGCKKSATVHIIRVEGSDTMVNIAQAWAEQYHQKRPDVSIQVLGGGSG